MRFSFPEGFDGADRELSCQGFRALFCIAVVFCGGGGACRGGYCVRFARGLTMDYLLFFLHPFSVLSPLPRGIKQKPSPVYVCCLSLG